MLKQLKKSGKTTLELEKELKESRYTLYHHLEVLKKQGIIEEKKENGIPNLPHCLKFKNI
ncbi:MAG: winged helix-turn-helix domain-containing protein [Candidatus Heimdallarchaeaceae archaeon]